MLFGNPVQGPRIVPFGELRTSTDVLPNGNLAFRVTQRFDDEDAYYGDGRKHEALDIGNYKCGDVLLAMSDAIVTRITDNATALGAPTDARGIHGHVDDDWAWELWHISDWTFPNVPTRVTKGAAIGWVGHTGLGNVCHCHIEIKYRGEKVDPYSLLESVNMFDDIEDSEHKFAIEWAATNGLIVGTGNGKFAPKQQVTREQMASILYREDAFIMRRVDNLVRQRLEAHKANDH